MVTMTIEAMKNRIQQHKPISSEAKSVKATLQTYLNEAEQSEFEEIRSMLCDHMPPEVLYSLPILQEPHVMHNVLGPYLVSKGGQYNPHPSTNRVVWGTVQLLYGNDQEASDRAYAALTRASDIATGSSNITVVITSDTPSAIPRNNPAESTTKIAHNMSMRFQKSESKFDGTLGQDYSEYISNYLDTAGDYNLNEPQKLKYLHHLFSGEAKQFHRQYVEGVASSFAEANAILLK
jgi:hypothetical protein